MQEADLCSRIRKCSRNAIVDKRSVCRLEVTSLRYDVLRPFNKSESFPSTGTGFFLEGVVSRDGTPLIVTAYHCVANAYRIDCDCGSGNGILSTATLVGANPELDVAILKAEGVTSKTNPPLPIGDSCKCYSTQPVQAVGFANGKMHLQATIGACSGRTDKHLQLDAAVNPGNSGGPTVDEDGKVIGIVVAGLSNAQNVNYSIPINETMLCVERILKGEKHVCNRSLNSTFSVAPLMYVKALDSPPGLLVTSVAHGTPLWEAGMRKDDILCELNGYKIDMRGRIDPSQLKGKSWWPDKLPFTTLCLRMQKSEPVSVLYFCSRERRKVRTLVVLQPNMQLYRALYPEFDPVPYTAFAGLVVQPLSINIVYHPGKKFYGLENLMSRPELHAQSVAVITHVLPQSPFLEVKLVLGDVITGVNDTPVSGFHSYMKCISSFLQSQEDEYLIIRFRSGQIASCSREQLHKCHVQLKESLGSAAQFATAPQARL